MAKYIMTGTHYKSDGNKEMTSVVFGENDAPVMIRKAFSMGKSGYYDELYIQKLEGHHRYKKY